MSDKVTRILVANTEKPPLEYSGQDNALKRCLRQEVGIPFLHFQPCPMEMFNPALHLPPRLASLARERREGFGSSVPPPLPLFVAAQNFPEKTLIPRVEDCHSLWDRFGMLENIRDHSTRVAEFALAISLRAQERGIGIQPGAALATGLLHDLGKSYTIAHGGNHASLGAAWVMRETRNAPVAQGVMFHVHWPFAECLDDDRMFMVMVILYADKRVKHDSYVTLDERFEDLLSRYGVNGYARARLRLSHEQGKRVEAALSRRLGVNLYEYTVDSGRLVKRA